MRCYRLCSTGRSRENYDNYVVARRWFPVEATPVSRGDCFATCARNDMPTARLVETQEELDALLLSAEGVTIGRGVQGRAIRSLL